MATRKHRLRADADAGWANGGIDDSPDTPSRSQLKRDSLVLQAKGEELSALSAARQAKLPLPPDLKQALTDFRSLSTHEARRRQMQYIGRLMREADADGTLQPILDAWARMQ